jgi:YHS domain-containing protein
MMNQIIKVLAILILFYAGYRIVKMFQHRKSQDVETIQDNASPVRGEDLMQDPLCKTYVPKSQAYVREIEGQSQYFCSRECCEKYLSGKK